MKLQRRQSGVALLEALVAVIILAIGLLGTLGMQTKAYSGLADAGMRAEATLAADRLAGLMASDMGNIGAYALAAGDTPSGRLTPWLDETRAAIPNATVTVKLTAPSTSNPAWQVDIAIAWQRKATDKINIHKVTTYLST